MARRQYVGVAVLGELLGGELAHGLEQPEPESERPGFDDQHRPVGEVTEQIVDVDGIGVHGDRFGRATIERAGEDRQDPEHRLLRRRQQVERPLDGRPQRAMPLDAGPPATGQEPQAIVQPLDQLHR